MSHPAKISEFGIAEHVASASAEACVPRLLRQRRSPVLCYYQNNKFVVHISRDE
jgi:hypothetical protein